MEEIFKVYKETNNARWGKRVYEFSNCGQIKVNGTIVQPRPQTNGYLVIGKISVHRAVAELFVPNPDNKPEVDHIDGDKNNNCSDNLRWVTHQENQLNDISRKKHSKTVTGSGNPMYGKTVKDNTMRGRKWMTNGKDEMKVFPPWDQDMLIFGWKYGRLKRG